jgi:hypothetical protein
MRTTRIVIVREPYLDDVWVTLVGGPLKRLWFALRFGARVMLGASEIRL